MGPYVASCLHALYSIGSGGLIEWCGEHDQLVILLLSDKGWSRPKTAPPV